MRNLIIALIIVGLGTSAVGQELKDRSELNKNSVNAIAKLAGLAAEPVDATRPAAKVDRAERIRQARKELNLQRRNRQRLPAAQLGQVVPFYGIPIGYGLNTGYGFNRGYGFGRGYNGFYNPYYGGWTTNYFFFPNQFGNFTPTQPIFVPARPPRTFIRDNVTNPFSLREVPNGTRPPSPVQVIQQSGGNPQGLQGIIPRR